MKLKPMNFHDLNPPKSCPDDYNYESMIITQDLMTICFTIELHHDYCNFFSYFQKANDCFFNVLAHSLLILKFESKLSN